MTDKNYFRELMNFTEEANVKVANKRTECFFGSHRRLEKTTHSFM